MDIIIEFQKKYWDNFNTELYNNYLKAKIEKYGG